MQTVRKAQHPDKRIERGVADYVGVYVDERLMVVGLRDLGNFVARQGKVERVVCGSDGLPLFRTLAEYRADRYRIGLNLSPSGHVNAVRP